VPTFTPYVTPSTLLAAPAGISWNVIPTLTAGSADQLAQLAQVCQIATSIVDTYCRQPLRAIINTETLTGPGQPRVSVDRDTGIATLVTRRWPVNTVAAIQTSPVRAFPETWTLVPAGQYRPRYPMIASAADGPVTSPSGGNTIDIAPGNILNGRGCSQTRIMASYLSGWPHAGLTQQATPVTSGSQTLNLDDVTGWAGVTGWIYDGQKTEAVTVINVAAASPVQLPGIGGTVQAGPGTVTLSAPLAFSHSAGTAVSALPLAAIHATVLTATVQALEGIDAIATQSLSGEMAGGTGALATESELLLDDFRRVA
jgi:hypothetical protein